VISHPEKKANPPGKGGRVGLLGTDKSAAQVLPPWAIPPSSGIFQISILKKYPF